MKVEYDEYTNTIRQQPQNYVIAIASNTSKPSHWIIDPDSACDKDIAQTAFDLCFTHHNVKWGSGIAFANLINSTLNLNNMSLNQDQKSKLISTLNEELSQLNGIISVKYFSENNSDDFVEVVTEEHVLSSNLIKMYHTLNLAGLICTDKLDDVEFEDANKKYMDIYYFKFV